eukprot:11205787-Lingulodinium_polyedra.AAC.1
MGQAPGNAVSSEPALYNSRAAVPSQEVYEGQILASRTAIAPTRGRWEKVGQKRVALASSGVIAGYCTKLGAGC